jgi:dihydroneopterin aldolase
VTELSGLPPTADPAAGRAESDRIELRGLRIVGTHGVLPEEKARAQPFEVDLDLSVDLAPAAGSDRLADTVDYAAVAGRTAEIVSGAPSYELLEALAGAVADAVLASSTKISAVTVSLRKLQPPLAVDIATVGVRITRRQ